MSSSQEYTHCRTHCAACCIAPSISSPIPGMPHGKPAGQPCIQLNAQLECKLFNHPTRPAVCKQLKPSTDLCRENAQNALTYLHWLEIQTAPLTDAREEFSKPA